MNISLMQSTNYTILVALVNAIMIILSITSFFIEHTCDFRKKLSI